MTFVGLLTNLFVIFFTNDKYITMDLSNKLFYIIIIQNSAILLFIITKYNNLPEWFDFKDKLVKTFKDRYANSNHVELKKTNTIRSKHD